MEISLTIYRGHSGLAARSLRQIRVSKAFTGLQKSEKSCKLSQDPEKFRNHSSGSEKGSFGKGVPSEKSISRDSRELGDARDSRGHPDSGK